MFGGSNEGVRKNILLTPENQSESVHASVQLGLDFPCGDPYPVAPSREDGIVHSLVLNEWMNTEKRKKKRREKKRSEDAVMRDGVCLHRKEVPLCKPVKKMGIQGTRFSAPLVVDFDSCTQGASDVKLCRSEVGIRVIPI